MITAERNSEVVSPTDDLRRVAEARKKNIGNMAYMVTSVTQFIELLDLLDEMAVALEGYTIGAAVKHSQISERGKQALAKYNEFNKGKSA